jgi:hypothetical protein
MEIIYGNYISWSLWELFLGDPRGDLSPVFLGGLPRGDLLSPVCLGDPRGDLSPKDTEFREMKKSENFAHGAIVYAILYAISIYDFHI